MNTAVVGFCYNEIFSFSFQLYKHVIGQRNENYLTDGTLSIQVLLNNWLAFSEKVPKGFGKYFGEAEAKSKRSETDTQKKDDESVKRDDVDENTKPEPRANTPDDTFDIKNLFFKENAKSSGGGSGKPIGGDDNNKEKIFSVAMLGAALLFGGIAYYSYAYKEVNWKEFTK